MDTPSPSGRRDNGLQSADWGALVDLDPRLSEALLSSLASADVPAFVEPAGGSDAWTRAAQLPDRPLHRLWVDPTKADTARSVVAAEVADLSALLAEHDPGANASGFVQAVPRTAAARVLRPPALPDPPPRRGPAVPDTGASAPSTQPGAPAQAPDAPGGAAGGTGGAAGGTAGGEVVEGAGGGAGGGAPGDAAAAEAAAGPGERPSGDSARPADPAPDDTAAPADPPGRPGPDDDDEVWRQIVADFGKEDDNPVPPWPVVEDVEPRRSRLRPSRPDRADEPPRRRRTDPAPPEPAAPEPGLPGWVEPEAVEDDGHYVPPPPPPVPRLAPRTLAAAVVVLAGLLLMFAPGLLRQPATAGVLLLGVLLTVGGAGALVWSMRDTPPGSSGPDDGAVV